MLSEGQTSNHKGAKLMVDALPPAKELLGDRGYGTDHWAREIARLWHNVRLIPPAYAQRKMYPSPMSF